MSRVIVIVVSIVVTAAVVIAIRSSQPFRQPWYVSQLASLEFSPVETDWEEPATPTQVVVSPPVEVEPPTAIDLEPPVIPPLANDPVRDPRVEPLPTIDEPLISPLPPMEEPPSVESIAVKPPERVNPPTTDTVELSPPGSLANDEPPLPEANLSPEVFPLPPIDEEPPFPAVPQIASEELPIPGAGQGEVEEPPFPAEELAPPIRVAENLPGGDMLAPPIDERDMVLHAAGAIVFRKPKGWRAVEAPFGREIRLLLLPPGQQARNEMPRDGVWLSYHVRPYTMTPNTKEIGAMLPARMKSAAPEAEVDSHVDNNEVDDRPMVSQAFLVRNKSRSASLIGFHMLIGDQHGVIEVHGVSPLAISVDREHAWAQIVNSLEINKPEEEEIEIEPQAMEAKRALGNWKAMRSVLQFRGDGSVVIISDPKRGVLLDGSPDQQPLEQVAGRFQAKDDLIMVRWNDGSRLNYRWKRDGVRLLLTDSDGRISQLRRFYK